MEELLGPSLLTEVGSPAKPTKELLKEKDLVLLYFSASWCPPCKAFSPILIDFYKACAEETKLEIVYVSSDRTVPDFEGYYKKMPWLSIPAESGAAAIKNQLAQKLGILGIPTLIVFDAKTGEFVGGRAREEVSKVGGDVAKAKALVEEWKSLTRKPLTEAKEEIANAGSQNPLMSFVMWIAKNPMFIFALLYFYKYLKKQFNKEAGIEEDPSADEFPATTEGEESEF
eukprot:Nitzschia sp. Nitz4//scaffold363_size14950//10533//11346//NITZ4_008906-RA/size14950-augustus-gene-0.28-mRNA-1//-1//CDS//3329549263//2775//frame0